MEFKDDDERVAFDFWKKPRPTVRADAALNRMGGVTLKQAREALLLSSCEVAKRLDMSPISYRRLEVRAETGNVKVTSVKAAAAAVGCECVFIVRPTGGETFAQRLWKPLIARVYLAPWIARPQRPHMRLFAMIAAANEFSQQAKFKKSQRWTRRRV